MGHMGEEQEDSTGIMGRKPRGQNQTSLTKDGLGGGRCFAPERFRARDSQTPHQQLPPALYPRPARQRVEVDNL